MTIRFAAWAKLWGYYLNRQAGPAAADNFSPLARYIRRILCAYMQDGAKIAWSRTQILIVTIIDWPILYS